MDKCKGKGGVFSLLRGKTGLEDKGPSLQEEPYVLFYLERDILS